MTRSLRNLCGTARTCPDDHNEQRSADGGDRTAGETARERAGRRRSTCHQRRDPTLTNDVVISSFVSYGCHLRHSREIPCTERLDQAVFDGVKNDAAAENGRRAPPEHPIDRCDLGGPAPRDRVMTTPRRLPPQVAPIPGEGLD